MNPSQENHMNRFLRSLMVVTVTAPSAALLQPALAEEPAAPAPVVRLQPVRTEVPPAAPPSAAAQPTTAQRPANVRDSILAQVEFTKEPLEGALTYVASLVPRFNYIVLRDSDVPEGRPLIKMKLKQVTLAQFLQLLQTAYPTITVEEIPGPVEALGVPGAVESVFCIKVHSPNFLAPLPPSAGHAAVGEGSGFRAASEPTVHVYRLGSIIDSLANGKTDPAARKAAMNHALSLISAAQEQVNGESPVIRTHEETETLVFKGDPAQEAALKSAMDALEPRGMDINVERNRLTTESARRLQMEKEKFDARTSEMDQQLARLQKMLAQRDKEVLDSVGEAERLKVRLEMAGQVLVQKSADFETALAKKAAEANGLRQQLDAAEAAKNRRDDSK
jgi:hypothetical protein